MSSTLSALLPSTNPDRYRTFFGTMVPSPAIKCRLMWTHLCQCTEILPHLV